MLPAYLAFFLGVEEDQPDTFVAVLRALGIGALMTAGGMSQQLVDFSRVLVGHLRAGLAHASVVCSMILSGVSGSSTADASAIAQVTADSDTEDGENDERALTDLVEQPAKVMRIGSMIRQLLEEVKSAPLDEASRQRLKDIHKASIKELETGLAPELVEELERLSLPFTEASGWSAYRKAG